MSNIKYSDEITKFLDSYNELEEKLNKYNSEINLFNHKVNTIIDNNESKLDKSYIIKDDNDIYFLLTPDKLLIKAETKPSSSNDGTTTISDLSKNQLCNVSLDSANLQDISAYYVSGLNANITEAIDNYPNTIVQYGPMDLCYNDAAGTLELKKASSGTSPDLTFSTSCNDESVYKCSSYAKMNNKQYFGLKDNTTNCNCYITDDLTSNGDFMEYNQEVTSIDIPDITGEYFGMMYDGKFYALKEKIFSDNFDGFYNVNTTNTVRVLSEFVGINSLGEGCHPYVGNGIYNLQINSLDARNICSTLGNNKDNVVGSNINNLVNVKDSDINKYFK